MRIAAYARYSSDQQRAASLDDQLRNCRAYAARQGWPAPRIYTDAAISGTRRDRPGYQRMLADVAVGAFDVLLIDDLSRLSRDSAECAQLIKRLTFRGVRLVGVSDGVDTGRKSSKLDVGVRGLMAEIYVDELAERTHRGLTGRALAGASAGGLPYGYHVTAVGQRAVDAAQAAVVRRIYAEYLAGASPREIAAGLNRDRIPAPRGHQWGQSAVRGDLKRSLGILVNPIYAGRQVWNRSKWVKDPQTGNRVRRERPQSEWVITEQPELRIVDAPTFDAVQRRLRDRGHAAGSRGRPHRYVLSGLLRCPDCGGAMVMTDRYAYMCAAHRERGTCGSRLRVPRAAVETAVLAGIRRELLTDAAFQRFSRTARDALVKHAPSTDAAKRRLSDAERVRTNLMAALRAGIITPTVRAELQAAEADVASAQRELAAAKAWSPRTFLPRAREVWQHLVADLADTATRTPPVREALRTLVGPEIPLRREDGAIYAEITPSRQIAMVAGARSVPCQTPFRVLVATVNRKW